MKLEEAMRKIKVKFSNVLNQVNSKRNYKTENCIRVILLIFIVDECWY